LVIGENILKWYWRVLNCIVKTSPIVIIYVFTLAVWKIGIRTSQLNIGSFLKLKPVEVPI
jgi:hypothetical protein